MMVVKIALLQPNPQPDDLESNIEAALELIKEASDSGAQLGILPEMWCRSYIDSLAAWSSQRIDPLKRWSAACKKEAVASIGSLPALLPNGQRTNRLYVIDANGTVACQYDKMHLFSHMNEDKRYTQGERVVIHETDGLRFGLSICYDLRFPELYRAQRQANADVLVCVAQWPTARVNHWKTLLRARAIENQCYMVGVNRCGTVADAKQTTAFPGASCVIDPWGDEVKAMDDQVGCCVATIDAEVIAETRNRLKVWQDRNPNLISER